MMGGEAACALEECQGCEECYKPKEKSSSHGFKSVSAASGGARGCESYYREEQSCLKCGKHAVNAILVNSGKFASNEQEMDDMSQLLGAPSNGNDYDMAVLSWVLKNRFGDAAVQSVGEINAPPRAIKDLISEVGKIGDVQNEPQHLREALLKKQFTLKFDDIDWVLCNVHYHWKTYFKDHNSGAFCDLDSIPAARGLPAATVAIDTLKSIQCRGVIVPTGRHVHEKKKPPMHSEGSLSSGNPSKDSKDSNGAHSEKPNLPMHSKGSFLRTQPLVIAWLLIFYLCLTLPPSGLAM